MFLTMRIGNLLLLLVCIGLVSLASANTEVLNKATTLLDQEEYSDAVKYIEQAMERDPSNAAIQHMAANVFGSKAQNGSVFSALGYAKKSLKALKEAVRLEPNNSDYRMSLITFYLVAPGIAGGNAELAKAQVQKINELDPVNGFFATVMVYENTDENDKLRAHIESSRQEFPGNAKIIQSRGFYYQSIKEYKLANRAFNEILALEIAKDNAEYFHHARFQIGRTSVISKTNVDEGILAFKLFLEEAPDNSDLSLKAWAKFGLAKLYLEKSDEKSARVLMTEAKAESNDKHLNKQIKKTLKKLN